MSLDCMVWLTGATVLGFVFGHWLGTRWGIRHARISQTLADGWHKEFTRLLTARLGESGKESK